MSTVYQQFSRNGATNPQQFPSYAATNPQIDSDAAFGGTGFMPPQQFTQTPESSSSSPAKTRDTQCLLPLTVKQISQAAESNKDKLIVDGVDVNIVKVVGMLTNKVDKLNEAVFVIDDGTGCIEGITWLSSAEDYKQFESVLNGMYVCVHGKVIQSKKQLQIYSIRPLTDYNEIANHFIECIYVHLFNTKLQEVRAPTHMPNSAVRTPSEGYQAGPLNQFPEYETLPEIPRLVIGYMTRPECLAGSGVHRNQIAKELNIPLDKINEAVASLEQDGMMYTTIDGDHYMCTTNG